MRQQSFASEAFQKYRKRTRKEIFLDEMNQIIPWAELSTVIEPYYPKADGPGRRPIGIERMLRIHFLQHWFELSDPINRGQTTFYFFRAKPFAIHFTNQ